MTRGHRKAHGSLWPVLAAGLALLLLWAVADRPGSGIPGPAPDQPASPSETEP